MSEWEALNRVEPLMQERGDYQAAEICTVIAGILAKRPPKIEDFLLRFESRVTITQTPDEMKRIAQRLHEMYARP